MRLRPNALYELHATNCVITVETDDGGDKIRPATNFATAFFKMDERWVAVDSLPNFCEFVLTE